VTENEVKSESGSSTLALQGKKIILKCEDHEDLSRDILKACIHSKL